MELTTETVWVVAWKFAGDIHFMASTKEECEKSLKSLIKITPACFSTVHVITLSDYMKECIDEVDTSGFGEGTGVI